MDPTGSISFHLYRPYSNGSLYSSLVKISRATISLQNNVAGKWKTILCGRIMSPRSSSVLLCCDNESGERFCFTSEDSHRSWRHCRYFQLLPLLACRQKVSQRLPHESNYWHLVFFSCCRHSLFQWNGLSVLALVAELYSSLFLLDNCGEMGMLTRSFYSTSCPDMGIVLGCQLAVDKLLEHLICEILLCRSDPREGEWH